MEKRNLGGREAEWELSKISKMAHAHYYKKTTQKLSRDPQCRISLNTQTPLKVKSRDSGPGIVMKKTNQKIMENGNPREK